MLLWGVWWKYSMNGTQVWCVAWYMSDTGSDTKHQECFTGNRPIADGAYSDPVESHQDPLKLFQNLFRD